MEKQTLPNSTLVLIMGILSIVGCCCYGIIGLICGIVAVVVAQKSMKIYQEAPENYSGFDNLKAGKIMGIIGIVLSIIFMVYIIWVISYIGWEAIQDPDILRQKMEDLQR